jgi:hypothetical protein
MQYAAQTDVSAEKSRIEIETVLRRYGATGFMYGWDENDAVLGFTMNNLKIQFVLKMPNRKDPQFWQTPEKRLPRKPQQAQEAWEQATRQRWRALCLVVKAKLEAVESRIATFEEEFMAHIVLPDGQSVGKYVLPQIKAAHESGVMPQLLPGIGGTSDNNV